MQGTHPHRALKPDVGVLLRAGYWAVAKNSAPRARIPGVRGTWPASRMPVVLALSLPSALIAPLGSLYWVLQLDPFFPVVFAA